MTTPSNGYDDHSAVVLTDVKAIETFAGQRGLHLALGYFDGIHRGHQSLLAHVLQLANERGGSPGVLLLEPHPHQALKHTGSYRAIHTLEEKLRLIRLCGDIHVFILPFHADFAALSPEAFARDYLAGLFHIKTAVCGYNYRFGRGGRGISGDLLNMGAEFGFSVDVLPQITDHGKTVSSTEIRRLIGEGAMTEAYSRLGHYHVFSGDVVGGRRIGSRLGFPTANLAVGRELAWPGFGVYGGFVRDEAGNIYRGAVNAGVRPTVNTDGEPSFEIYLLDFEGDLYGSRLQAVLTDRLRPEAAFTDLEALRLRIEMDLAGAESALTQWENQLTDAGSGPDAIFSCFIKDYPI